MTTKGWGDEEVERVYARSRELCEQLGDAPRLLQATWGLIVVSVGASRAAEGASTQPGAARAREEAAGSGLRDTSPHGARRDRVRARGAHRRQQALPRGRSLYNPRQHRSHIAGFGVDMGVFSRSWATHFLWHAGHPDRARAKAGETLSLACELSHPLTRAIALAYATMLHQFCRESKVEWLAEATITLCTEHGFPYYLAWAEVLRGWSRAARGAREEGIAQIRRGIEVLQSTAGARLPYYRALLAEACTGFGRIDEALQALADGFADVRKTEERWWRPSFTGCGESCFVRKR